MQTQKNNSPKLSLKKEVLAALDDSEMVSLTGGDGILSIGHQCSHNNDCSRIHDPHLTKFHGGCEPQQQ